MSKWSRVLWGCVVVGLVGYAYFGHAIDGLRLTACGWLFHHWKYASNYSHGPLIPLMSLGLVFWKRRELLRSEFAPSRIGPWVVALAMLIYYIGVKVVQERVVVFSFVVLLYGLALALGGRDVFRVLFFPISFLLLMIPLDFLDNEIGFPLRQFVAHTSTVMLNWLGIVATRLGSGTAIHSSVFEFDVDDPCSGIRSLMALTTVTAFYAYITQTAQWKRWVLFLCAIPLAVLGNLARVISIALVAQAYGQEFAMKVYHDYSGYIVFSVAIVAMVLTGVALNFPYRRVVQNWVKPLHPTQPKGPAPAWRTDE